MVAVRWRMRWHVLAGLVREHGWLHGAELGVLRGETFLYLLDHCQALRLVGVDLWRPRPEQDAFKAEGGRSYARHDLDAYHDRLVRRCLRYGRRATLMRMETVEAARWFVDGEFDFVFIDADHTEAGVRADIEAWRPKVRAGGWLMGHDYNALTFPGVVRAVDALLVDPVLFPDHVWGVPVR